MAKMVIFSAVSGKVVLHGAPVAGAQIERSFVWGDETGSDRTTSAADGSFSLPAIERRSFLSSLFASEPFTEQTVMIEHAGKRHKAWYFHKRNYRDNGELDGKPIRMRCPLEAEPAKRGKVFGICELE